MSMILKDTMKYRGFFSMHQTLFIIELLQNKKIRAHSLRLFKYFILHIYLLLKFGIYY